MKILGNSVNLTKVGSPLAGAAASGTEGGTGQGREAIAAPVGWGFLVPKNFLKRKNTAKVPLKLK